MATYVVLPRGYKEPGKLIRVFTDGGIEFVEVRWTKYSYKDFKFEGIFVKAECVIIRKPTGWEKKIRDFFSNLFR